MASGFRLSLNMALKIAYHRVMDNEPNNLKDTSNRLIKGGVSLMGLGCCGIPLILAVIFLIAAIIGGISGGK